MQNLDVLESCTSKRYQSN